jgi:hypothetical protein
MGKVADLSVYTPGGQPGAPNPSEGLAVLRQNQTAFMETIGVMPPESLTIADGAISPTTAVCIVDTEGGAPADDLATINATLSDGSTLHDGMVILLSAKDASRVVTVKNSDAPNGVKTVDGKDIALSTEWSLVLQYVGGVWQQLNVSAPLKPATASILGGVKPQGGDGALNVDAQGNLRVEKATKTQRGSVLASEIAQSSTVPQAGADGKIANDWLPSILCNTREILTSSGTYLAPVTGWYRLELRGGGGAGGAGNTTNKSYGGGGGGSGGILVDYAYLTQGESYSYIIGAGGEAKKEFASGTGGDGGETSFTTTSGKKSISGGKGGGNRGASAPAGISGGDPGPGGFPGGIAGFDTDADNLPGGSGGMGVTAALSGYTPGQYGSGGAGGYSGQLGHDGVQGCIILDYFDPDKEAV